MKNVTKRIIAFTLILAAAFSLFACGKKGETVSAEDTLTIGTTSLGDGMFAMNSGGVVFNQLVMQTLTRCHYADEYAAGKEPYGANPCLAESLTASDDYLTWTLKLRKGVQWQGGYGEFTTADVDFTWKEIMDPENEAGICYYFTACDPENGFIDSWEIVDDYTMTIHCSRVEALLPLEFADMGFVLYCKKYIEEVGMEAAELAPIGTGPWVYNKDASVAGESLVFDRSDSYWGTASDFKRLEFKLVGDSSAALRMMQDGQIDMFQIDAAQVDEAEALGYRMIEVKDVYNLTLCFGGQFLDTQEQYDPTIPWAAHTDEPEDSEWNVNARKVREALCLAIDKDAILENMVYGYGERSYLRDFFQGMEQSDPSWDFYGYDPAKAKTLLAEAGYADGFAQPIKFLIPNVASYGIDTTAIANACCDYLEAIGLTVDRQVMDASAIETQWRYNHETGWSMTMDWGQWVPDPLWAWTWNGTSTSFEYRTCYTEKKDAYINEMKTIADDDARYALERECAEYLLSEYTECAICSTSVIYCVNDTIADWAPMSSYEQTMNWNMNLEAIHKASK